MRIILRLLFIGILVYAGYFYKDSIVSAFESQLFFSFCDDPIEYHVSFIDEDFETDRVEVTLNVNKAADIWNAQRENPLFVYNPESKLDINLVFDERQRALNRVIGQEKTVQIEKIQLSQEFEEYEERYEMVNSAIEELNMQIEYWNKKGGAPPEVYEDLIKRQEKLNKQVKDVNTLANKLNTAAGSVNEKIDGLNETIEGFNKLLDALPEEGLYDPIEEKIEIYFYDSQKRFIHTVAHELGHALGLRHIMEPESIMHPTTSENAYLHKKDIGALDSFCEEQNKLEFLKTNLLQIINNFQKSLATS